MDALFAPDLFSRALVRPFPITSIALSGQNSSHRRQPVQRSILLGSTITAPYTPRTSDQSSTWEGHFSTHKPHPLQRSGDTVTRAFSLGFQIGKFLMA